MKKKVHLNIYEYSCERREIDAQKIYNFLKINDYVIVKKPCNADIIFFVSCGITEKNTEDCINYIKKYQQNDAELIIGGCGPAIDTSKIKQIHKGKMISTKDLNDLDILFPNEKYSFKEINDANSRFSTLKENIYKTKIIKLIFAIPVLKELIKYILKYFLSRTFGKYSFLYIKAIGLEKEYYVRIASGCLGKCTYCSVLRAIGDLKSKPLNICIDEFKNGLRMGFKNFTITGDDTGAYGVDCNSDICQLLDKVTSFNGDYNIVISSFNPAWLIKHVNTLVEVVNRNKIKCIVIPTQSGSSRILSLMKRYSDIEKIKNAVIQLKKACNSLWISTHIIIGFPSETEKEFFDSLHFVNNVPFDEAQIFAYCKKEGTKADNIRPIITESEISRRMTIACEYFKRAEYKYYFHKYDFLYVSKLNKKKQ